MHRGALLPPPTRAVLVTGEDSCPHQCLASLPSHPLVPSPVYPLIPPYSLIHCTSRPRRSVLRQGCASSPRPEKNRLVNCFKLQIIGW
ncbi:hypothetical protein E2C01_017561 [Portunus trituberculatus]|uniref:Uncharacterized protein n=1 Tax=Portunus trituberculatus TaxID=210409 RepID=A0A5B7DST3_PORTR|nr:hypothetical protein [Portunus trituberculatus]